MKKAVNLLLEVLLTLCVLSVNVMANGPDNVSKHDITVRYVVNTDPKLIVPEEKTVFKGESFDPLEGVSATDEEDGDLTNKVSFSKDFNLNEKGTYTITYTVTDRFGGEAVKTLTLNVIEKIAEGNTSGEATLKENAPVEKVEAEIKSDAIVDSIVREGAEAKSDLEDDQKEAIKSGADVKLELVVDKSNPTADETNKIEKAVKNKDSNTQIGTFLDVSLLCTVTQNNSQVGSTKKVKETGTAVKVSVTVPDTLVNKDSSVNRKYDVARLHNGTVELLGATYDSANKKLTFSTDRFSTYAIVYTDTKVEQAPVYIPNKKKPVVNTGYGFDSSVIDISEGSGLVTLNVESLKEYEALEVKLSSTEIELKSKYSNEDDSIFAVASFDSSNINSDGKYKLTVSLKDPNIKPNPGVYEATLVAEIEYKVYEAKNGEDYYESLKAALSNASKTDVVTLLKDIVITDNNLTDHYYVDRFGCTLEGNGHTITMDTSSESFNYFARFINGTIKDVNVKLNGNGGFILQAGDARFENIDLYAEELHYSGNDGAFLTYAQGNIYFDKCSFDGKITGTGSPTDYGAVFVGYAFHNAELLSFVNCKNYGDITLGRPALFVGNPNLYTVSLNIENFENYGDITGTYINEYYKMNYYYAVTSNCYTAFIVNDVNYGPIAERKAVDQQIPSCMDDQLIVNTGNIVNGVPDTGLSLVQNEDGTFTVTPVSDGEGYRYVVGVGLYVGISNGSTRFYITEELDAEKLTTTIKNLKFVDETYVSENSESGTMTTDALGNRIFENDNDIYYVVDAGQTTNGVKSAQMIYVSAFDSQGNLVASSNLSDN